MFNTPGAISRGLDRVLPFVQKPARYTGGEFNSVVKDWNATPNRLALIFPDVYDLGMSNLGLAILYDVVNRQPDMLAERAYTPWVDMIAAMRREGIPLYSLETRHPLADFDVLGFTLPYEQLYTNVLTTLDLAGVPLRAAERVAPPPFPARACPEPVEGEGGQGGVGSWPLILAGGAACLNPEPMHAFFDAFFIGEGEEAIVEIVRAWTSARRAGLGRGEALLRLAQIEGVYVPSFYRVEYREDGTIAGRVLDIRYWGVRNTQYPIPNIIKKRILPTLPPPPTRFIVPFIDIVHNRAAIEIQRGCTRGCRFCQAGMVYRPVRERPLAEVVAAVDAVVADTGFEEIGFLSLSSSDYSQVEALVAEVVRRHGAGKLSVSLPSLRIESFSVDLMEQLEKGRRRSGFTFAPEAATDRLRNVINKPIADDALLEVAREVFGRGWPSIKLYFMIGHPTQTLEDVQAIADLAHAVRRIGFKELGKRAMVRMAVSTLVPKPHTPFQWLPMADEATIRAQIGLLESRLRGPGIEFSWNNPAETLLEAALSRGDRRLAEVIQRAWELGAGFDAWGDQFNQAAWTQAFAEVGPSTGSLASSGQDGAGQRPSTGSLASSGQDGAGQRLDPDWYARRERGLDEILPWDHINVGVTKKFLAREYCKALAGETTADCRTHPDPNSGARARCYACGILAEFLDERRAAADDAWGCPPVADRVTRACPEKEHQEKENMGCVIDS